LCRALFAVIDCDRAAARVGGLLQKKGPIFTKQYLLDAATGQYSIAQYTDGFDSIREFTPVSMAYLQKSCFYTSLHGYKKLGTRC